MDFSSAAVKGEEEITTCYLVAGVNGHLWLNMDTGLYTNYGLMRMILLLLVKQKKKFTEIDDQVGNPSPNEEEWKIKPLMIIKRGSDQFDQSNG